MDRGGVLRLWLLGMAWVLLWPLSSSVSARDRSDGPARALSYVESSTGLRPPAWEEGDTELEMADVNGDGHVDIVSVGDHGNPEVNSDEKGLMVWLGNGAVCLCSQTRSRSNSRRRRSELPIFTNSNSWRIRATATWQPSIAAPATRHCPAR